MKIQSIVKILYFVDCVSSTNFTVLESKSSSWRLMLKIGASQTVSLVSFCSELVKNGFMKTQSNLEAIEAGNDVSLTFIIFAVRFFSFSVLIDVIDVKSLQNTSQIYDSSSQQTAFSTPGHLGTILIRFQIDNFIKGFTYNLKTLYFSYLAARFVEY